MFTDIVGLLVYLFVFLSSSQHLEACLFAFRAIAEGGDFGDDVCVSNLLQLLPQINMSHGTLASTALYMLGKCTIIQCRHLGQTKFQGNQVEGAIDIVCRTEAVTVLMNTCLKN